MKNSFKNLIKFTVFIVILFFLILKTGEIFIPERGSKSQGTTYTIKGFYALPKNSIDILFLGDSSMLNAVSPMELWDSSGITSYNYSVSSVRTFSLYYLFKDALKTQTPKILVIDSDTMFFDYEWSEPLQRYHVDYLKNSKTKFDLISDKNYVGTFEDDVSVFFPLLRYHSRWQELKITDFYKLTKDYSPYGRGYYMSDTVKPSNNWKNYMKEYDENVKFENSSDKYLEKFVDLCEEKNIKLMVIQMPNSRDWGLAQSTLMTNFAKEHNIDFIDFNVVDFGMNWLEDTKDGGVHLNILGTLKLSQYLENYLKENYELDDHRGEKEFEYWNEDYEIYKRYREKFQRNALNNVKKIKEAK